MDNEKDVYQLLQTLSPQIKEIVIDKLSDLEDDELFCLSNVFSPFPASNSDGEWFILPQNMNHLPHRKTPTAEGLKMKMWQKLVFAEVAARNLGKTDFWSKENIENEREQYIQVALKGYFSKSTTMDYDEDVSEEPELLVDENEVNECFQRIE